jgi:autotransporter-associated beta strand protein
MKPNFTLHNFLALAGSSLLAVNSASAQSQWTNTTSGTQQWNTATNWDTNPTVPNGAGVSANLSVDIGAAQTVNLATPVTLGSLTFGDSTTGFFAQNISGSALTFDNNGSAATLTQASASGILAGTISTNVLLNDDLTIVNNGTSADRNNAMQLTGVISGSGGITINSGGGAAVYLTNTGNTYSGGLTLNAANAKIVTGTNSASFGTGTLTINGGFIDTSTPSGAQQLLVTTNDNVWNANFDVNSAMWNNNGNVTLGSNVAITSTGDRYLGLGGNIGETGGSRSLTISTGAGGPALRTPIIFAGTNTYTGGTTVNGGIATFMKTASMPTTGNISFATGTSALGIAVGGAGEWTTAGTGAGTLNGIFNGLGAGGATLTYGAAVSLNLIVTGNQSYGAITNLGSSNNNFTKSGIGTLTITGDNTFGGQTILIGGGGYTLDYVSSNTTKFGSGVAFFGGAPSGTVPHQGYGGGTITLNGGSITEGLGTFNLGSGGTFLVRENGGTSKLRFNAMNGRNVGSTISFGDALIAEFDRLNVNGILGGWATLGDDWAINSTNAGDGAVQALVAYDGALATSGGVATENNTLAGGQDQLGLTVANTVKITSTGSNQVLDLGANNLTITSAAHAAAATPGGIMYAGGGNGVYEITGSTGRITSSTNNSELIFAVQDGTLKVSAIIGASSNGNSPVTKTGAGTLEISSTNATNGAYYVNQGVLRLASAAASGAPASFGGTGIYVQNNAALELTGGFSFPLDERMMITGSGVSNGGALRSVSGANTWQGLVDIGIGGARINNDDAANTFTLANGSTYAAGVATVAGGSVTFGGVGNTTVSATAGIYGAGGVIKDGAGTLTLSATNTYIGATTVSNGTLALSGSGSIATSSVIKVNTSGTLDVSAVSGGWTLGATQTLTGTGGVTGTTTIAGTHAAGNNGVGSQAFANDLNYSSGSIFEWDLTSSVNADGVDSDGVAGTDFDSVSVTGNIDVTSGAIFKVIFGDTALTDVQNTENAFWNTPYGTQTWNMSAIFGQAFNLGAFTSVQTSTDVSDYGSFSISGTSLTWTAIPEPTSALAGLLLTAGLLRRRRK